MTPPAAPPPVDREKALIDVTRVIVASALTIGSVLLTAFGFVERMVGIERIASDRRFALLALMPGAAALAFLASGRALGALYDVSVPPRDRRRTPVDAAQAGGTPIATATAAACDRKVRR